MRQPQWSVVIATCLLLAGLHRAGAQPEQLSFSEVQMVPLSSLQLGEYALIAPEHFERLGIEHGHPAHITGPGSTTLEVRLYPIDRAPEAISLKRTIRDALGVTPGPVALTLQLIEPDDATLPELDLTIRISLNEGDPAAWPGVVLGAPHGDCDLYTGEIAELATELAGIPSVSAYRVRISYLGRWIDANRPLERRPRPVYGIESHRSWTDDAEAVYAEFREQVLAAGGRPAADPAAPPLALYIDFHGHDLTYTAPDGTRKGREVAECMARGFSLDEVRWLKSTLEACLRAEHGEATPAIVFGNLPEDRRYEMEGVEVEFFYSGLGARVYGILGSAWCTRAIHIETPNVLRIPADSRPRTARALAAFAAAVRDRFVHDTDAGRIDWIEVPGGRFTMGGDDGESWSSTRPQRVVELAPFHVARTETTNAQYLAFLRSALASGAAHIAGRSVVASESGHLWLLLGPQADGSRIIRADEAPTILPGFEQHPVVAVTWHGAVAFARRHGARLPTEAEWEFAAGWDAATDRPVRWREARDADSGALPHGNYMHAPAREAGLIAGTTTPVGAFPRGASPVGCLDTVGNAWEWTADWYAAYPAADDGVADSPTGPPQGTMKVIRGGAWDTEPMTTTPIFRLGIAPHQPLPTVGFRVVRP